MPQTTQFPAFLQLQYDENGANARFHRDIGSMTQTAEQKFKASANAIDRALDEALSRPRNIEGALDLGVPQLKLAAQAAKERAAAADEMSRAIRKAAMAENDFSQSSRLSQSAANALAMEQREAARAAISQATAAEQVQLQLNKQAAATTHLSVATRSSSLEITNGAKSLGSQRFAMIQVGQQLQDITVGFAGGQRAATIFAQQLPQLGFALTGFNGKLGALGRILAGPIGVAIFAGITVAAYGLTEAFKDTGEAAKEAENGLSVLEQTSSNLEKSVREVIDALKAENDQLERNGQSAYSAANQQIELANANLRVAKSTREKIQADAEFYLNQVKNPFRDSDLDEGTLRRINSLQEQAAAQTGLIEQLDRTIRQNTIVTAQEEIAAANDAATQSTLNYKTALDSLNESYGRNDISKDQYLAGLNRITKKRDAEAAVISAAKKTGSTKLPPVTLSEVKSILERELGAVIGSTTRTKAQNRAVGGSDTSYHLFGQALDLPFSKGNNAKITKDDIRRVLAEEGIAVEELLGRGDKDHNDHNHIAFSRRRRTPEQLANSANKEAERAAAAAARETSRLASLSDQAAESIARINEQYDEQPRLVDRAAQSTRKLDGIISELSDPKNAGTPRLKELIKEAQEARALAGNAVNAEIDRYAEDNDANLDVLRLQAAGLEQQADILIEINRLDERLGLSTALENLTEQQIIAKTILEDESSTTVERAAALVVIENTTGEMKKIGDQQTRIRGEAEYRIIQEERLNDIISRRREETGYYLEALNSVRGTLTSILSGQKTDILGDLKKTIADLRGSLTFESLFGDAFAQIEQQLNRNTPLGKANAQLVDEVDQTSRTANEASQAFALVGNAAVAAATALNSVGVGAPTDITKAANDNQIVVTAIRDKIELETRSISDLADAMANGIVGPLAGSLNEIFGTKFSQQLSGALSSALSGYLQGGEVGGVLGGLQGITKVLGDEGVIGKGFAESISKTLGSAVDGAGTGTQVAGIAKALGLGKNFSTPGSQIGGAIGSVVPIPGGEIIGSVVGGLLGGLFKKTPDGNIGVTGIDSRTQVRSSKASVGENLGSLADALTQNIQRIADALGADVGNFSVSLGQRNDYFRVGADANFDAGQKHPTGALYDGTDADEAMRIALLNAIQDGAIAGIRAGAQRLLASGKDLDAAIQDVLSFNSVFDRLKAYKDPVGAALDALDKEFNKLVDIFDRAGASAEEYAELEELYGIERAQAVKEASERITGSLRDLFRDLTIGDSGLSLRSRLGNAQAEYDPLAQRVAAGDITAYDDYADAAGALLELQREVYGSSEEYFRLLDEVTNLTKSRIDEETNIASIAVDRDTPFKVDQTPVVNAVNYGTEQMVSWLQAIAKNTGMSITTSAGGGGVGRPDSIQVVNF